jgi:ribosome-binding protein aMBF1 (putative translation factor)
MRRVNEDPSMIKSFAEKIDVFISKNNLTNQQFGDKIGVNEATIRKYRKGEVLPSHEQMKKITKIMKMHYHDIMGYEDPTKEEN